jgi:hypothetical protein
MSIYTSPGYVHLQCITCEELINIPVSIKAVLQPLEDKEGYTGVTIELAGIDLQPMYDHKFNNHMNLFDDE